MQKYILTTHILVFKFAYIRFFLYLIYDKEWRLAPAYDLLPCGAAGDYHTTSVNNNPLPERADILLLADRVGLDKKQATAIFDEMKTRLE